MRRLGDDERLAGARACQRRKWERRKGQQWLDAHCPTFAVERSAQALRTPEEMQAAFHFEHQAIRRNEADAWRKALCLGREPLQQLLFTLQIARHTFRGKA